MSEKKTTVNVGNNYVMASIAFIVIGVLFCYSQAAVVPVAMLTIGTILTVLGLLELINRNFIVGAIEAAIGIVLIVLACTQPNIALILLGVAAILFGLFILLTNFKSLKSGSTARMILIIGISVFAIIVGALFITAYAVNPNAIFIAIGALSLVTGVLLLARRVYSEIKSGKK